MHGLALLASQLRKGVFQEEQRPQEEGWFMLSVLSSIVQGM